MQRLFIILILLFASTWLGWWIMQHPGHLLIVATPRIVPIPLALAVLFLVFFLILFYLLIDSVDRLQFSWTRLKYWLRYTKTHRLLEKTERGLISLFSGRFREAERYLRHTHWLEKTQFKSFEKTLYCAMMRDNMLHRTLVDVHNSWQNAPRSMREEGEAVLCYVKALMHFGETASIPGLIQKTLQYTWQSELVTIYSKLPFNNISRQFVIVGAWQKLHGDRPAIFLALGELCVRQQLWGKAKDYFEKCLRLGPNQAAYLAYGHLLQQLGERDEALEKYRMALIDSLNV